MIKKILNNNKGFKWFKNLEVYSKGFIHRNKKEYFEGESFNAYVSTMQNKDLQYLNGYFSIVYETDDILMAAVDHLRSMPLFYAHIGENFFISDNINALKEELTTTLCIAKLEKSEFLYSGLTTGRDTLYDNIYQLPSGEFLVYDKITNHLKQTKYFRYTLKEPSKLTTSHLINKLETVYTDVVLQMIRSLNNQTIVLPLSGGYDSRLIAVLLKRLKYTNVICYSYGKKGNWESQVSKAVAESLGFSWYFVEYKKTSWKQWYRSSHYKNYELFASNNCSISHLLDWPAVKYLKDNELIPKNSIFVPGHSGDFLAGSHIKNIFINDNNDDDLNVAQEIFDSNYKQWKFISRKTKTKLLNKINNLVESYHTNNKLEAYERWDMEERQAKFIVNSVRVYEYFDYKWRMPLWDKKVIEVWSDISRAHRYDRSLYYKFDAQCISKGLIKANPRQTTRRKKIIIFLKKYYLYPIFFTFYSIYHKTLGLESDKMGYYGAIGHWNMLWGYITGAKDINSHIAKNYLSNKLFFDSINNR